MGHSRPPYGHIPATLAGFQVERHVYHEKTTSKIQDKFGCKMN
jgi:hypothetical protein